MNLAPCQPAIALTNSMIGQSGRHFAPLWTNYSDCNWFQASRSLTLIDWSFR